MLAEARGGATYGIQGLGLPGKFHAIHKIDPNAKFLEDRGLTTALLRLLEFNRESLKRETEKCVCLIV